MKRIFIGFDGSEAAAYWVSRLSLYRHAAEPKTLTVRPLVQQTLRMAGLYWRFPDPLASTEFTYTRFLVPHLARYRGWALFMDCDMLCRADIGDLFALADPRYAVMCVKHDYEPADATKMDGKAQTLYPRKNWSSLVLYNCGHPANRALTLDAANSESGSFLHRFQWLDDDLIGELPVEWNWLEGWHTLAACPEPRMVHYTRGIPGIHDGFSAAPFADEWLATARAVVGIKEKE